MLTGNPQQNNPPTQQTGGTHKRSLAMAGRNANGTPLRKMRSLNQEGREPEKQIDQSDYEEAILETEELYHYEEEAQGYARREYGTNGASNYSTGGHLLIKPKLSSFTSKILNHPMSRIKMPSSKYDGTSDPDDHVAAYEGHMFLYTQVDAIWGKVFHPRRREHTIGELLSVKQGENESLRDYIGSLNVEAVSIPRLQQDVAVDDRERYDRVRADPEGGGRDKGERKERFDAYTQLTTSRSHIYLMNKDSDKWQRPKQMFHKNRDKSIWCDFHGDYDHLTEDCRHLKDNLEDLLKRGYFSKYKALTKEGDLVKPANRNFQSWISEIHVISGGPIHGGSVSRAKASLKEFRHHVNFNGSLPWKKPPAMPVMSFTLEDAKHVVYPHNDPLVVTMKISNCLVHRIFGGRRQLCKYPLSNNV
ncbi:uncharacterized protein LOC130589400 [Beta vulgaris subsp. vulgaris]|uniref:uncharacterized protein LOC130589400 n=1 Tax=Beta vulgaris subsp. vulgaris TaxID=3555 RepID=UPI002547202C|nr:uncharacterized protein LOC130589400 [Beta vulgaris subsp. vulgaris]